MTNTIMTAKNTFAEGLVMDFAPDNTQATTLTSALNATLLTFNGNEMSLQNDMGNGRVETAYLPEGYVPVGTCEFGDIIYIVSYNPITNKSQIGCFPSPERNISSEEVGGMGQSLKWTDFQGSNGSDPNGELVASSVKKILYGTKDMTSGDKYIIYSGDIDVQGNNKYLSDYKNTSHQHGRFPKLVKIHVVSIEESGKITYLDSTTKWYKENNFYIQNQQKIIDKPDLDSYRTMVSSAYSIFSSKVSGKLALLVELEKITGFSCTWNAYTKEIVDNSDYQMNQYSIYWNFSWTTEDFNINPSAVVLTESKWTGEDSLHAGWYQTWEKNEDKGGWMLGGVNKQWIEGPTVPTAYPTDGYNYVEISRVYKPESYNSSFEQFISSGSYEAQSEARLSEVKTSLGIPDVELTKVNLSRTSEGVPYIGNYYFNCSSSGTEGNKTVYYTSYNNELKEIVAQPMSDDIINNTFNYPIVKHFSDFTIPVKQKIQEQKGGSLIEEWKDTNINNLIYYYELTPAMPYGLLREYSQDGYIDFKKIGTKSIKLNSWRYFNYENTSTFTWGLEAYTEPNKGISEVIFLFYDNQGIAAAYHNSGKSSYNGKFTEYFTLNTSGTNYKLNNKNVDGVVFHHKGESVGKESATITSTYLDESGSVIAIDDMAPGETYYLDDAGTLYSNCLYLVKIIVKYCNIGVLDEYIEDEANYIEDYRWYWTNTMFNDYYYSVQDFEGLQFSLNLNCKSVFETDQSKYEIKRVEYLANDQYEESIVSNNAYKSLSANVQYINQDGKQDDNIKMSIRAGLQEDYNTFNIEKTKLDKIDVRIFLANEYISNSPEQPSIKFTQNDTTVFQGVYPTLAENLTGRVDATTSATLNNLVGSSIIGTGPEIYTDAVSYQYYKNNFHVDSTKASEKIGNYDDQTLVYISSEGDETSTTNFSVYKTTLDQVQYDEELQKINGNKYYPLTLSGIHYSKYYYTNKRNATPANVLRSFVSTTSDLAKYALSVNGSIIQYNKMFLFAIGDEGGESCHVTGAIADFNGNNLTSYSGNEFNIDTKHDDNYPVDNVFNYVSGMILNNFHFLFPVGFGHTWGTSMKEATKNGTKVSSNRELSTGTYSDMDLGGTLAAVLPTGLVEVSDQYGSIEGTQNSLRKFTPIVLGYLTQLFYLDTDTETDVFFYPDNYAYLSANYTAYKRDIAVELSPNIEDHNQLLVFNGLIYTKYLEAILKQFQSVNHEQLTTLANNVNLKLYSCLKTTPIEVHIDYINPSIDTNLDLTQTLVKSIFQDIPSKTSQQFNKDTIYSYNPSTNSFGVVRSVYNLRKVQKYSIQEDAIIANLKDNTSTFYIGFTNNLLGLVNNQLAFTGVPSSSGTYSIATHKKRYITGFKSNLRFYN